MTDFSDRRRGRQGETMSAERREQIRALQKLDCEPWLGGDDDNGYSCRGCHRMLTLAPEMEPVGLCESCLEPLLTAIPDLLREADTLERHLKNLLARIHRDGGHYTEEHGLNKSAADADRIVARFNAGS